MSLKASFVSSWNATWEGFGKGFLPAFRWMLYFKAAFEETLFPGGVRQDTLAELRRHDWL